jgi:hypothetical protein
MATGGSVTSWIRSKERNAHVGGVPSSLHRAALAVDVVYDTPISPVMVDQIALHLGLEVVHERDHDHVQPKG